MESVSRFFAHYYISLLVSLAIVAAVLGAGWIIRKLLFSLIRRWTAGTDSHLDIFRKEDFWPTLRLLEV
jgi:hypothetical protein